MLGESSCTLYKFNGIGFDRFYIPSCHWQENRAANVIKSGLQTADSVTIYLPKDSAYPKNPSKDMLVEGDCDFDFNNESSKTVSESMKDFRKLFPNFVTVSSVDRKLYGSPSLQHIKVSAK